MKRIRVYPDPILRKKAKEIENVDADTSKLLAEMTGIMQESKGIGLAAPQVGVSLALIVVDGGEEGILKLVNPKITSKRGKQSIEEGCLSFPELGVKICRAKEIKVKALNEKGESVSFVAKDLPAIILQHEIDHLEGKLIIDYVSWPKRWFVTKAFKNKKRVL